MEFAASRNVILNNRFLEYLLNFLSSKLRISRFSTLFRGFTANKDQFTINKMIIVKETN